MPSTWPLYLRRLIQETTILFTQCYELARERTAGSLSTYKRLMAQRDEALLDAKLCRREIAVLRRNRESLPHHKRPDYSPEDRFEILQITRLRQQTNAGRSLERNETSGTNTYCGNESDKTGDERV